MIKELTSFTIDELLSKLINSSYAFACWRLPHSDQREMAISLQGPQVIKESISTAGKGFVINAFTNSHPIKPTLISADIHVTENDVQVNPKVSADQMDAFVDQMVRLEPRKTGARRKSENAKTGELKDFETLVQRAKSVISSGDLEKVVLARYEDHKLPSNFDAAATFSKLIESHADAFCSLFSVGNQELWMGATPELIISQNEETFETVSLAGTKAILPDQSLSEIAWTQKEIEEQAFVSRYVINCFKKIRLREFHEHGPKTIRAGHLAHLKTSYQVSYKRLQFDDLADQMLELLHPTSAVCGMPLEGAGAFIMENEEFDREYYSGFLGPVNFDSKINLFVNLRCVKIMHDQVRYFGGAGITEDSVPAHELKETSLKMAVMRDLIEK